MATRARTSAALRTKFPASTGIERVSFH